jgi:hypothetical protein
MSGPVPDRDGAACNLRGGGKRHCQHARDHGTKNQAAHFAQIHGTPLLLPFAEMLLPEASACKSKKPGIAAGL